MDEPFAYPSAFSRNIGWVTKKEQQTLRHRCVAIAGMGGVGGSHLLTLTRMGIGHFRIADFDTFELANFNRQAGASIPSLGRPKVDVLAEQALSINPELDIQRFPEGVTVSNLDTFLDGADVYLDGLDFFALAARRAVFGACAAKRIPAVTAAPLGMGAAMLTFLPDAMNFEDYFQLDGRPEEEQLLCFLLGLSPAMLQTGYLVDPSTVDLAGHRGPSTAMACELCAGLAATQVLKVLLGRGPLIAAPRGLHFDAYRNKMRITWRPGGNRHPLQRLALAIARRRFGSAH
ncbi:MAG TPA: ThiF family adenylyltransferase [Gammaproteobacteria bacterium]|nr:ThiF family adenylyltransferase [Gammaproteobacteria bacterium]